jgi:OmpA-OmpF porin, OOP family
MKFRVFSTAVVLLLAATSAEAQRRSQYLDGLYVSGQAGGTKTEEAGSSNSSATTKAGFSNGFVGTAAVGYGLGNGIRGELEGSVRQATVNKLENSYQVDDGTGVISTIDPGSGGRVRVLSLMGNAIYDIPTSIGLTPFVGAGVGGARVELRSFGPTGSRLEAPNGTTTTGSKIVPAYQGIAGVNYSVTNNIAVGLTYRYFATDKASIASDAATPTKIAVRDHSVTAGLTWSFNAQPNSTPNAIANVAVVPSNTPSAGSPQFSQNSFQPSPPQAAAAPAQSAQAAAAGGPRAFTIFFEFDKAAISADADRVITQAAETAKAGVFTRIRATGHTDTVGTPRYNMALSIRRANAVRDVLVREGIPATQIVVVGRGETQLLVPTPDNVNEPRNRRVEIVIE